MNTYYKSVGGGPTLLVRLIGTKAGAAPDKAEVFHLQDHAWINWPPGLAIWWKGEPGWQKITSDQAEELERQIAG